ncbi:MAG: ABC transporter ATP-binding protein [Deltaproteobacteria bacterium]|nr:ABC transporter ATP-binding protein [Deltaproteobacteria bacterium]
MNPVLEIEHLSFQYRENIILQDISFNVSKGEFVTVIGPNGCGKTTLINIISKINRPGKGRIRLYGRDINPMLRRKMARQVAIVMQTTDPVAMTVEDYVLLGRLPFFKKYQFFENRHDIDIAKKYMEMTGVIKLAKSKIHEISGGERQLASIARALAQEPSLLVMDEPTSHLDITRQARILELIRRLRQELSLTVLMVLHDLNLAGEYSDRLVLLNKENGRIFKAGTPEEVLTEQSILDVYHTRVMVLPNPVSNKPLIFLASQDAMDSK